MMVRAEATVTDKDKLTATGFAFLKALLEVLE